MLVENTLQCYVSHRKAFEHFVLQLLRQRNFRPETLWRLSPNKRIENGRMIKYWFWFDVVIVWSFLRTYITSMLDWAIHFYFRSSLTGFCMMGFGRLNACEIFLKFIENNLFMSFLLIKFYLAVWLNSKYVTINIQ